MRTSSMDQARAAIRAFCAEGKTVTVPALSEALGLCTESQKQVLRRRLAEMVRRGEAEKTERGEWRYIPGRQPSRHGESYIRIWRIIRVQTPGWSKLDVARLSRFNRTITDRYVSFLENEGLVERAGRDGNTILWRTTARGREQRETPYPPRDLPDPYAAERAAVAGLCQLMLTRDPGQPCVREKIREHLSRLADCFCTQPENEQPENPKEKETDHA